jgi:hypothetical protein
MKASEAIEQLCSALAPEIKGQHEFELALGALIAKHRRMLRESREVQAVKLTTPAVVEVQGCHRATAYRRRQRGLKVVARLSSVATEP